MNQSSLKLKLELLNSLREGKVEKSHQLLNEICKITKSNPDLYGKFQEFISENKKGCMH